MRRFPSPLQVGIAVAVSLITTSIVVVVAFGNGGSGTAATAPPTAPTAPETTATRPPSSSTTGATTTTSQGATTTAGDPGAETTTTTTVEPIHPWVDRRTVGGPWQGASVGLLTFRGNPTNTWYGTGPVPASPGLLWRYPDAPLCGESTDLGVTSTWCGNGWTGQPVVWERPDGVTELMVGAYDHRFHFIDALTGRATRTPIPTGDLVKGSPSLDPDGYPLVYFGSRDNRLRIAALDREDPAVLWSFETPKPLCSGDGQPEGCTGRWNDDWDGAPLIVNDYMFVGGENSIFYIWRLNRAYDDSGQVAVDPELVFSMETWDAELMSLITTGCRATAAVRCTSTSVESTAVMFEGRVYFGTSAGRVIGLDVTGIDDGAVEVVFDYWVGDDVDASIVIDAEGMLYVPVEWKRFNDRGRELGQLVKLDPYTEGDPYVWGMFSITEPPSQGGLWSTPALGDGVVYAVTNRGYLVVVDQETGEELWTFEVGAQSWSSPAIVDDTLLVAGHTGLLHAFDISDATEPALAWTYQVGAATVEATPAVWNGIIYLFSRDGYLYAIAEQGE